jgi:hypothetical protein
MVTPAITASLFARIAVLANPAEPDSRSRVQYAQVAAHALRVQLHVLEVLRVVEPGRQPAGHPALRSAGV